jgi:hypothetical protein
MFVMGPPFGESRPPDVKSLPPNRDRGRDSARRMANVAVTSIAKEACAAGRRGDYFVGAAF